jgi:hypothetical protein
LADAQGPYYFNNYDPTYVYLINSLNLAQLSGYGVGHFDHPGTTVQVMGALVVKIYYSVCNNPDTDIASDVLKRPESYLYVLNKTFLAINCVALFMLGLFTFKVTNNFILGLSVQLSPFASMKNFYGLILVTPENLLVTISIFITGLLIYYLFKIDPDRKIPFGFIIAFAVICGFGLATKLNFIPVCLIPILLIKGVKNKIIWFSLTIVSFCIFVFPALSNYSAFAKWIGDLFLHSGRYGKGPSNVVDTTSFFINLKSIFGKDILFTIAYFSALLTLILNIFNNRKSSNQYDIFDKKVSNVLTAVVMTMTLQVLLVAKHYYQYYMIPSFMLIMLSILLTVLVLARIFFKMKLETLAVRNANIFILIVISVWSFLQMVSYFDDLKERTIETLKIENYIDETYRDALISPVFTSSSLDCARIFAAGYAGSQIRRYNSILMNIQREHIVYNPWANAVYRISRDIDVRKILLSSNKIVLQIGLFGSPEGITESINQICGVKNSSFEKKFENSIGESIYEVKVGNK